MEAASTVVDHVEGSPFLDQITALLALIYLGPDRLGELVDELGKDRPSYRDPNEAQLRDLEHGLIGSPLQLKKVNFRLQLLYNFEGIEDGGRESLFGGLRSLQHVVESLIR